MRQTWVAVLRCLLLFAVLASALFPHLSAQAAGVVGTGSPASCTEAAFDAALSGGGTVTFNCGATAATITLTNQKAITQDTVVQGGNKITLSGGGTTSLFHVIAPAQLTLSDILVSGGTSTNSDGGAIVASGTVILTHVTMQNNKTALAYCGGAVWSNGLTTITDSTFSQNVSGSGGAICTGTFGTPTVKITNSTFISNQAVGTGGKGGAIWIQSPGLLDFIGGGVNGNLAVTGGGIVLTGSAKGTFHSTGQPLSFSANTATDMGGAIYNEGPGLTISNADFIGNSVDQNTLLSGYGGAIYNQGQMTVSDGLFENNKGRFGGAIFVGGNGSAPAATLSHLVIDSNNASQIGGGLYTNVTVATVNVSDTVFSNNQANAGGGLARFSAVLAIHNSSFTSNQATTAGGGLELSAGPQPTEGGYVEIHDSTIAGNTAPQGGGLYNTAEADLGSVTIVNNSNGIFMAGAGAITRVYDTVLQNPNFLNCDGAGLSPSSAGGNFSTDNSCALTMPSDQQGLGLDAMLDPLKNDGPNTTWYAMPQAGSPLINKAVPSCSPTDQRHATRPDACDIGAVEFGGVVAVNPPPPPPGNAIFIPMIAS